MSHTLREKCPFLELFWSLFSRIRFEYKVILRISSYSVQMRENTDQENSEYEHFLRSDTYRRTNTSIVKKCDISRKICNFTIKKKSYLIIFYSEIEHKVPTIDVICLLMLKFINDLFQKFSIFTSAVNKCIQIANARLQ